ncbi:unnamed protein product [Cylindrotheca closterium]|uniref:RING-type domain-containing protein n=1 Tax=Cylindrotheca closterium TaxID=2856 RepID=A0AAD2CII1_9STRA|nr:unnamed protein product [Cylindrotheca closterium]
MEETGASYHQSPNDTSLSATATTTTATTTAAAQSSPLPSELNENNPPSPPSPPADTATTTFKIEDFECILCLRLLYEPTTLKCGHSFCRTCVEELYQQNHAKCPTCRQVLPIVHHYSSEKMSIIAPSFTLCKFLEVAFPLQYKERHNEIIEMYPCRAGAMDATFTNSMNATTTTTATTPLPLFYLDPMVPRQVMQLNIFEHRYLLLISRCLEGSRHFGMVGFMSRRMIAERRRRRLRQAAESTVVANNNNNHTIDPEDDDDDDDEALSMIYGVEVEIVESSPQPTGTMHIQVKAKRRFKIVGDTWRQDGYTMSNVQWLALPAAECTNTTTTTTTNTTATTTNPLLESLPVTQEDANETQDDDGGDNAVPAGEISTFNAALSESQTATVSQEPAALSENDSRDAQDAAAQDDNARAIQLAQALGPLVEEWKALVVAEGWQRYHGQLAQTINTIGPMPEANDIRGAIDRALWVTALINPLPGMGVAPEIRPEVLEAAAAATDNVVPLLLIVTHGMRKSIEYLTPNAVLVWMQYQLQKLYCLLLGRGTRRLGPPPPLPGTHQMVNALLRLLVVCLVLGFFWQRILAPKRAVLSSSTVSSSLSSSSSPAEEVLLSAAAAATASPNMDTETAPLEL